MCVLCNRLLSLYIVAILYEKLHLVAIIDVPFLVPPVRPSIHRSLQPLPSDPPNRSSLRDLLQRLLLLASSCSLSFSLPPASALPAALPAAPLPLTQRHLAPLTTLQRREHYD